MICVEDSIELLGSQLGQRIRLVDVHNQSWRVLGYPYRSPGDRYSEWDGSRALLVAISFGEIWLSVYDRDVRIACPQASHCTRIAIKLVVKLCLRMSACIGALPRLYKGQDVILPAMTVSPHPNRLITCGFGIQR